MLKRFSIVVPVIIFLILIFGVGYLIFTPPSLPTPTIEITDPPVLTPTVSTLTPTKTPEDPASATPVPSITPIAIVKSLISTPIFTITPLSTDTPASVMPTSTLTPSPTPTLPVIGSVLPDNLNVRWGPGLEYGYVGAVYKGDEVVILRRTPLTDWLEVITPDKKQGWVGARFITTRDNLKSIPTFVPPPQPPLPTAEPIKVISLNLDGPSILGDVNLNQDQWYSFSETDQVSVFVLIFRPNFNGVQFSVLDQDQTNQWRTVGVGSRPASDRDGDLNTGELIWRGGPLIWGKTYFLRLINESQTSIEYCLAPKDIDKWDCP